MLHHKALAQLRIEIDVVYALNDTPLDDLRGQVEAQVQRAIKAGMLTHGHAVEVESAINNVRVVWRGTQVESKLGVLTASAL
jgi:hypothetical protein